MGLALLLLLNAYTVVLGLGAGAVHSERPVAEKAKGRLRTFAKFIASADFEEGHLVLGRMALVEETLLNLEDERCDIAMNL